PLHHPEFTMMEWYRSGTDYTTLMTDCEAVMRGVAKAAERTMQQGEMLRWQGKTCDPNKPAERLTVQEAFARFVQIDLLATNDGALAPNADRLKAAAVAKAIQV